MINKDVSYIQFTEDWDNSPVINKLVWAEDALYLANEAVEIDLFFGVSPADIGNEDPENIVWNRTEVLNQMVNYKLKQVKEDGNNEQI